ncbi:uncharacterized protein C15orf39-like isoform X2 [Entelurus aequoreus]|uniref:uncharacterized protein C15orf39-like isoform X2 n=1 Tax=Entelurus aequoreus TaxID=161455 RepID=UPI002B1DF50D|nr:uncharacterized protein C15orf39-like isoform X2 [Entelurus aequoreus]
MAFCRLSKPSDMSGFLERPVLQYGGPYFSSDPRGLPSCINSNSSLLDARSPISHLSSPQGQSLIFRRQDSSSSDDSHSSSKRHRPLTLGFTADSNKNAGSSIPTAATIRETKTGDENASLLTDSPVYLAIPRAMYGHNPCCHNLSCMMGHRYSVAHGSQQMLANTELEHNWTQAGVHNSKRLCMQRKADTVQRGLQLDSGDEQIRIAQSTNEGRTMPARTEPNYGAYPYMPHHSTSTSLSEQNLQPSPRGYAGIHPSHATCEHMTSEIYQECSPMSKYGNQTKQPMFYSPQATVEVKNRTHGRDTGARHEEAPPLRKHTTPNQGEHYLCPRRLHGDIPLFLHSPETLPHHSFVQGFDYPCYAFPGFHLGQLRTLKRQHASPVLNSNSVNNVSPSGQYLDHPISPVASSTSQHVGPSHTSHSFLRMDQIRPTRCQPVSPSPIQARLFFPSPASRHIDQAVFSPPGLTTERLLDYSACVGQVTSPNQPRDPPVSPMTWLPLYPNQTSDCILAANNPNLRTVIVTGNRHSDSSDPSTPVHTGNLKSCVPHTPPLLKIKEEALDLYETDSFKKQQPQELKDYLVQKKAVSPQMPVIDNVFSLAPYLSASRVLPVEGEPQKTPLSPKKCEINHIASTKEIKPDPEGPPTDVCRDTPVAETFETTNIKVEKINPPNGCDSSEGSVSQAIKDQIKTEPEDTTLLEISSMLVIKKCEPEELETKPTPVEETELSDEPEPPSSSCLSDVRTLHEQQAVSSTEPPSQNPPQPPGPKFDIKNSSPESLKISNHKISLRDVLLSYSAPPQKVPIVSVRIEPNKPKVQAPVRKHFIEMHRSLCKLVSKCVSATPEQQLRTWLSKQELPELPTKILKISCLLGIKARRKWHNEDINSALQEVLDRLMDYTMLGCCPFPYVMRTGDVFLPMLVVKEILFPIVPVHFVDQVLQKHKVELRPTTLSEEKILIQFHKRSCSSRLRRLMSLKHLPSIYMDVLNLFYYSTVCKHLESTSPDVQKNTQKSSSCSLSDPSPRTCLSWETLPGGMEAPRQHSS